MGFSTPGVTTSLPTTGYEELITQRTSYREERSYKYTTGKLVGQQAKRLKHDVGFEV